jgi:chromosomal replication initiator protein
MTVLIDGTEFIPRDGPPLPVAPLDTIKLRVAHDFGITVAELEGERRTDRVAWARQVAMYLARTALGMTLEEVGQAFGNRDHGTVMHACRVVTQRKHRLQALRGQD